MDNIWITKATYHKNFELELEFNDGTRGIANLKDHLDKPVFEPLKDPEYFKSFQLGSWTVSWDNGADFAPEFLYHLVTRQELVK